jgi:hypothetical protein
MINQIKKIENRFHELIMLRAKVSMESNPQNPMPTLSEDCIGADNKKWYAINGMYGGFSYYLNMESDQYFLLTSSWSRIVGGSGQTHKITPDATVLLEEGFV